MARIGSAFVENAPSIGFTRERGFLMGTEAESVRRYFEARVDRFGEPYRHIGSGGGTEFVELPHPEDYVPVPGPVLEACGFYYINVLGRDNGGVYVFQADADGTPTFGVLATSDGSDAYLEVYGAGGELFGAAVLDRLAMTAEWSDAAEAVRRRAGIDGF